MLQQPSRPKGENLGPVHLDDTEIVYGQFNGGHFASLGHDKHKRAASTYEMGVVAMQRLRMEGCGEGQR